VPLLVRLLYMDEDDSPTNTPDRPFFIEAIQFLIRQSLLDLQESASSTTDLRMDEEAADASPRQRLSRTVAASLPPALVLMHRLLPSSSVSSSTLTSMLSSLNDSNCVLFQWPMVLCMKCGRGRKNCHSAPSTSQRHCSALSLKAC
jgi:hypothetical protein